MRRSLLFSTLILFGACSNDVVTPEFDAAAASTGDDQDSAAAGAISPGDDHEDEIIEPEGNSLLLRVTGDGIGLALAGVRIDEVQHFTDGAGFMLLEQLPAARLRARVDASGYTSSAVALELGEGIHAYHEVELFPLGPPIAFLAEQGGLVEHGDVLVHLEPGSFVDGRGEPVYGVAEATITSFDPTSADLGGIPGPLHGNTIEGNGVGLLTVAMAEISLWQDGKPLQLAPGATATLELPLPPEIAAHHQIGDSIPGWSLDLDTGIWQQENLGTIQPSQTTPGALVWATQVEHFSWYNVDVPKDWADFKCYIVSLRDEKTGALLPNQQFRVSTPAGPSGLFTDGGYSSSTSENVGSNCVHAPMGSVLHLTVSGHPGVVHELPLGNEASGLCTGPSSDCTLVQFDLPAPVICTPGSYQNCFYSGPPETKNVGVCRAGRNYCVDHGTAWSGCQGEITPTPESCYTTYDDDCDGSTENWDIAACDCIDGTTIDCYEGPFGTKDQGICAAGKRMCEGGKFSATCKGQVLPEAEVCATLDVDENCDGIPGCAPPAASALELKLAPVKRFEFSWMATPGGHDYQLFERANPAAEFVQKGNVVGGTTTASTVPLHRRAHASYLLRACNPWGCTDSEPVAATAPLIEAIGIFKSLDGADKFGRSVALSSDGGTLAVGSNTNIQVFVHDQQGEWLQQAALAVNDVIEFGFSIALSSDGHTLAVGSPKEGIKATGIDGSPEGWAAFSGAVYVFERNEQGQWSQQAYVKASNTDSYDEFGNSVALSASGDTLAVGAWKEDSVATGIDGDQGNSMLGTNSGAAYVFVRDGQGQWSQQAYVKASNPDVDDGFGWAVALAGDGDTLAVAAPGEDSKATGINGDQTLGAFTNSGAVYVFERDEQGQWAQQVYIKASNTNAHDNFGWSVALAADADTLAVGAVYEDSNATGIDGDQADNSAYAAGAVYVFGRDGQGQWSQQAYVKASNTGEGDRFGSSVALSGDGHTLGVGAPAEDSNAKGIDGDDANDSASQAGAVYVFENDGQGQWAQQAYVKASNTNAFEVFGSSVAISTDGDTLGGGAPGSGSVYVY